MNRTNYDPEILQQQADDLYAKAKHIELECTLKYGCSAFIISFVIVAMMNAAYKPPTADGSGPYIFAVLITLFFVAIGKAIGKQRAFNFRLQAQQILCQRQIEVNTRIHP